MRSTLNSLRYARTYEKRQSIVDAIKVKQTPTVSSLITAEFGSFYLCHQERRVQHFHEVLNHYMAMP
jgi:hypothetical protein